MSAATINITKTTQSQRLAAAETFAKEWANRGQEDQLLPNVPELKMVSLLFTICQQITKD